MSEPFDFYQQENSVTDELVARDKAKRLCVICGAKVININQKAATCSPFCTDAKKKGMTYAEAHEMTAREESEIKPVTSRPEPVAGIDGGHIAGDDSNLRYIRHEVL